MWLMTPVGFFSVVQKPGDAQARVLTVRARVRADLEALRERVLPELGPIRAHQGTDYAYRAQAPQAAVARALAALVMDVAYDNFKNEVNRVQGHDRAHAYGEVWHALYGLGEGGEKRANARSAKGLAQALSHLPEADAYGGLVVDDQHRVLLREPTNHFGGYVWTFPKGGPNPGETPLQAALREVAEETGVQAEVVGHLPFAYPGTTGTSAFAVMRPVGQVDQPGAWDAETAALRWAPLDEAQSLLAQTQTLAGRKRDLQVLADLVRWLQDHPHALADSAEGSQP